MNGKNGEVRIVDLSSDKSIDVPLTSGPEDKSEPWLGLARIKLKVES